MNLGWEPARLQNASQAFGDVAGMPVPSCIYYEGLLHIVTTIPPGLEL